MTLKKTITRLKNKLLTSPFINIKTKIKLSTYQEINKICRETHLNRDIFIEEALSYHLHRFDYYLIESAIKNLACNDNKGGKLPE
jgi:hypothetical protein